MPPELLCDGLIGVGQALSPALEVVIENHVDTVAPVVIEGKERARAGGVPGRDRGGGLAG